MARVDRSAAAPRRTPDGGLEWPLALGRGYVAVLGFSLAIMVGSVALVWIDPEARAVAGWVTALTLAVLALIPALSVPTRYRFGLEALEVRAGLLRYRAPYAEIESMEVRSSYLSSTTAGWTFQRVVLTRRHGVALELGPADRLGFAAEILARAPQLRPDPRGEPGRSWVAATPGRS